MTSTLSPCTFHKPNIPCNRKNLCPVRRYIKDAKCDAITPGGNLIVQAWMQGVK
jgi:hypothetical protein